MFVVDCSALMAMATNEPLGDACEAILGAERTVLISAGTLAETAIVASSRSIVRAMESLLDRAGLEVVPVTAGKARRMGAIYRKWGRGFHPAGLNFDDCFAYELATERDGPLLFVGDDFAQTDVKRAL